MHKVGTESDEPWLPHSKTSIATSLALQLCSPWLQTRQHA